MLPAVVPGRLASEVVEVGHCHVGLGHAHVWQIPPEC
jgi:hypothetical protein